MKDARFGQKTPVMCPLYRPAAMLFLCCQRPHRWSATIIPQTATRYLLPTPLPMKSTLFLFALLAATATAQTTYVSTLGLSSTGGVTRSANQFVGGRFVTDNSAPTYTLNSISLALGSANGINDFTVNLMTDSGANTPGTLIGTLSGPVSPTSTNNFLFSASGLTLNANTSYWVTMGFTSGAGSYEVQLTNTLAGATGPWTLNGNAGYFSGSWIAGGMGGANNLLLSVQATAIPEPSTYALLFGVGVLGLAAWRRRRVA
jgi:hypothetical protein